MTKGLAKCQALCVAELAAAYIIMTAMTVEVVAATAMTGLGGEAVCSCTKRGPGIGFG